MTQVCYGIVSPVSLVTCGRAVIVGIPSEYNRTAVQHEIKFRNLRLLSGPRIRLRESIGG